MSDATPGTGALAALASAGLGLARRTTSGRVSLAHLDSSIDVRMLPSGIRDGAAKELADATQRSTEQLSAGDVEKILRNAWGDKPSKVLDEIDLDNPVAVTPGSQVHRGVRDGAPVAIKVLRPGLSEIIRADLSAAEALSGPMGAALPHSDFGAIMREVRERTLDELDLEQEKDALRSLGRALRGSSDLNVPAPVSELATSSVLVSAWVDGTTLADAAPADPADVGRRLATGLLRAARAGAIHADPSPPNVLVAADGSVTLVDAGASARIDENRLALAERLLRAFLAGDDAAAAAAIVQTGWLDAEAAARAVALGRDLAGPLLERGVVRVDAPLLGELADAGWARIEEVAALAGAVAIVPTDIWPLRSIGVLCATIAHLAPEIDIAEFALSVLEADA